MNIQTKSTAIICGLFIIEILPIPFTSLYSLYAVGKRPKWLLETTQALYQDKVHKAPESMIEMVPQDHDHKMTQRKCGLVLLLMFIIDLLVPVVIPTAFYVVRARPLWFKRLLLKLYADKLPPRISEVEDAFEWDSDDPAISEEMLSKLAELERHNQYFAKSLALK